MSKKIVAGFIIGAAVGTLAGILLAPAKGAATRKRLLGKIKNGLKKIETSAETILDSEDHDEDEMSIAWEQAERPYSSNMAW